MSARNIKGRRSHCLALTAVRPLFLCDPYVNSQLVKGSIKTIVVLPKYVDANEWLALNGELSMRPSWHAIDGTEVEFFQHLNQFYGVIAEVCTNRNCPR